ncbi:MAG: hypothetical protein DWH94_01880 [Planctomycetota bacterium]|nr:MAG: hypothetical protein DWH94_01880 [Planctomycetota bacterium]
MPTERVVDLKGFPNIIAMDLFATPTQKRLVSAKLRVIESSGVSKKRTRQRAFVHQSGIPSL